MTISLGPMMMVGTARIAVLTDCTISAVHTKGAVLLSGHKRPLAVLINQAGTMRVFSATGTPMTREQTEDLCPGAWRRAQQQR